MSKWFTRKNIYYLIILIVCQLALGIHLLNNNELFWGGFFLWACGYNFSFIGDISRAPDQL